MSIENVSLQPGFILHARLYRDTSLLLELFTPDYGRVSALARGARGGKRGMASLLQPFTQLLLSWRGKTELMTLTGVEPEGPPLRLQGNCLLCGFYLNEVLMRVLQRHDAHPDLYQIYSSTLQNLSQSVNMHSILRLFEKRLLIALGYALQLDRDIAGNEIEAKAQYCYAHHQGLLRLEVAQPEAENVSVFSGQSLLALHAEQLSTPEELHAAKRLLRIALRPLLGDKPLRSRELFQ